MDNNDEFLTYNDVAKLFKVSEVTIWSWVKKGFLPSHKMGRHVYFIYEEIKEAVKEA